MDKAEQNPASRRDEGRRLAVEMILFSQFGRRESNICERVIHSLRNAPDRPVRNTPSRWQRFALPLAASVMAVIGTALWFTARTQRGPVVARITEAKNGWRMAAKGKARPLTVGDELRADDHVGTTADGTLKLAWVSQATTVVLEGQSSLALSAGGKHLLRSGRLTAMVARRDPATPFVVETPHARLTVVGTVFAVRIENEATRMEVNEGAVRMTRLSDDASVVVPAGHGATAGAGLELKAVPVAAAMEAEVLWCDSMDSIKPWLVTEWREKGGIAMDIDSAVYKTRPGALRLRYAMPGRPPTRHLDEWVVNVRSVERRVVIPDEATHMRFWLKVASAKPRSRFAIWLCPEERRSGWAMTVELEGMTDAWRLIEADLQRMPEFWSKDRGTLRGNEVPPMRPSQIAVVELSLNLGDTELIIDDLEFIQKGPP